MPRLALIISLLLSPLALCIAQQNDWQYYYEQLVDDMQDETDEDAAQELSEMLSAVAAEPLNINAVTRADLEDLLFLSNNQVEAVLDYVHRYGPLLSKGELMMIPYLDDMRRNLLSCLTYIGSMPPREETFLDTLRYEDAAKKNKALYRTTENRGELTAYGKLPLYTRKGDRSGYRGYKYKHWLRFRYNITNRIKVGFVASQDAGEPFFANKNKAGYDYYSAYIQLRHMGIISNFVAGRYRIKTGLGLVMNNNLSFGKTFGLSSVQTTTNVIRPHSSRSEANYLQGAAATLALSRHADITLFASYRKIDATLADSASIRTILTSGYHRTDSELERRHNASQTTAGIYLRTNIRRFNVGLTGVYNRYNLPLNPYKTGSSNAQLYRYYYPSGQNFWNISVNYGYRWGNILRIEGETATGDCGRVATVNTLSWRTNSRLTLYALYRYYPVRFYTTTGKSFSEGGRNQDESGLYAGATWIPNTRFSLSAYTDFAYFAWPKYQALGSSHSFDNLVQATYKLSPNSSLSLRYRLKLRQKNGDTEGVLTYKDEQRLRLAYMLTLDRLSLRSQIDASYCKYKAASAGVMISQTARYTAKYITLSLGAGYFNTKDYNSRVYIYEQSLPYTFASMAFYGKGIRAYCTAEALLCKTLSLTVKGELTHYFDRDTISSGYQTIYSSTQSDIEAMLRWKF
ncbi:MAG: helix-hairpin-helix domain-containing protein [Prevotella sp.]|nr:helix-hairpin-helix domain-containing protein [Prevotella sp.]